MTIHNQKVPTISEYEYREISWEDDGTVRIAEKVAAQRDLDLRDPSEVNPWIVAL